MNRQTINEVKNRIEQSDFNQQMEFALTRSIEGEDIYAAGDILGTIAIHNAEKDDTGSGTMMLGKIFQAYLAEADDPFQAKADVFGLVFDS